MNITKKEIVNRIKKGLILFHDDIPLEFINDIDVILAERVVGIRITGGRGYDIIENHFFINESILENIVCGKERWNKQYTVFDDFDKYYEYLDGDIYTEACYYQCGFPNTKYKINKKKFYQKNSLVEDTIDDYKLDLNEEEKQEYQDGEDRKKLVKKWIEKFNACDTYNKLLVTLNNYKKSCLSKYVDIEFFFWNYILNNLNSKKRFNVIMKYMSTGNYPEWKISKFLCHLYDPDKVVEAYKYSAGVPSTQYKHISDMKKYAEDVKSGKEEKCQEDVFFDKTTHFYCVGQRFLGVKRYFETLEELLQYRDYNLSGADLSDAVIDHFDSSNCLTDNETKLPVIISSDHIYRVTKYYEKNTFSCVVNGSLERCNGGVFWVIQRWYDTNNILIKQKKHGFRHFFDFVSFLKGDLSGADLLMCDNLMKLKNIDKINFEGADITSDFCEAHSIEYIRHNLDNIKTESFDETKSKEVSTELILHSTRDMINVTTASGLELFSSSFDKNRVYYISDIHLVHKIINNNVKSISDVKYIIKKIVFNIVSESRGTLLIDGDTACDFGLFTLFVQTLRDEIDNQRVNTTVIFTLGNHELWGFENKSYKNIVNIYKSVIEQNGMYLLESDILYRDNDREWNSISDSEIIEIKEEEIRNKLREARIILFGGLGFSGFDEKFNANKGIYRSAITREQEIEESKKFFQLYKKVLNDLPDKRIIICTHMPLPCWSDKTEYNRNYIYVSGHTHENYFYDDGEIRIYADNQIGYRNNNPHTKYFEFENEYDYMCDYKDGIHIISKDDYTKFYRGKNLSLNFNWKINKLYMLKKNGFYCFIHETPKGSLTILNGGSKRGLIKNSIDYYYDNMEKVIATVISPLDKYTSVQKKIAAEIKKIGGSGNIHGCIVDIDFYNHIYVNPYDLKITPYSAVNIIYKRVYSSIPLLLEKECPKIYASYKKAIQSKKESLPVIYQNNNLTNVDSQVYLDTDIYKASREIKRMQKLTSNILTFWKENIKSILLD